MNSKLKDITFHQHFSKLVLATLFLGQSAFAYNPDPYSGQNQTEEMELKTAPSVLPPVQYPADFQISDLSTKPWLKDFQYIVVVNKAIEGKEKQSITIYKDGSPVSVDSIIAFLNEVQTAQINQMNELILKISPSSGDRKNLEAIQKAVTERSGRIAELLSKSWTSTSFKVSTGRDAFEKKGEHHSQKDSWTVTPTGYFVPQYFAAKHKSESYSNTMCDSFFGKFIGALIQKELCTYMENAIFFNEAIALHKAIPGTEDALGEKASGGCVRLPAALAEYLFLNIGSATSPNGVPAINVDGSPKLDTEGKVIYEQKHTSIWGTITARSALIIVKSQVVQ